MLCYELWVDSDAPPVCRYGSLTCRWRRGEDGWADRNRRCVWMYAVKWE